MDRDLVISQKQVVLWRVGPTCVGGQAGRRLGAGQGWLAGQIDHEPTKAKKYMLSHGKSARVEWGMVWNGSSKRDEIIALAS